MTVRAIDPETGDIVTNNVQFINGVEEIEQTIKTRLRLFAGEYFRNINEGIPWFDEIMGKAGTASKRDAIIKNRVINTPGVVKLTAYNATFDLGSRTYNISMTALTRFGAVELNLKESV